jgi:hypothetical protein
MSRSYTSFPFSCASISVLLDSFIFTIDLDSRVKFTLIVRFYPKVECVIDRYQ